MTKHRRLSVAPVTFADASAFVDLHHRHHCPPQGHKFSLAAVSEGHIVGIAMVGRPVSRHRDDGATLEITRLCTNGHRNAASFLLGAAARATFALGYLRLGTYILENETGTSLKAAGWKLVGEVKGRSWNRTARPRVDKHPTLDKLLWEVSA